MKVLTKDNYLYLGQFGKGVLPVARNRSIIQAAMTRAGCLGPMRGKFLMNQSLTDLECWQNVHDEIKRRRRENRNIILSSEFVSDANKLGDPVTFGALLHGLKEALADEWNVVVVVGYRRYFEWTGSAFRQDNANRCLHRKAGWSRGHCGNTWNSIKSWMERDPPSAKNYLYTDTIIDRWQKVFPVKILNYHSPGHITEKFLCDMLPDAPHSCAYAKSRPESKISSANARDSVTGAYSTLATIAFQKGILDKSEKRSRIVKDMTKYFQGELNLPFRHLPLRCPPRAELEKLLNISLTFEKKLMPEWYLLPDGEQSHRDSFWRTADERKEFCSVNSTAVFHNKSTWEEVLEYLANREFN